MQADADARFFVETCGRPLAAKDVEAIGRELDAIRRDIEESRGERDARYVRNTIRLQRGLEVGGHDTDVRQR